MAVSTVPVTGLGAAPLLRHERFATFSQGSPKAAAKRGSLIVRAEQKDFDPLTAARQAVDKNTKVNIDPEEVKRTMQRERDSVFGTVPPEGSPLGRSELERRPETGRRDFFNLMAFDGPGPETINGRLAMLGCVAAFMMERATGLRVIEQVNMPNGLFWPATLTYVIFWASLVPMFNGESPDSRRNGPFTAKAERWNGRLAMIGFAGILLGEVVVNGPIFALWK